MLPHCGVYIHMPVKDSGGGGGAAGKGSIAGSCQRLSLSARVFPHFQNLFLLRGKASTTPLFIPVLGEGHVVYVLYTPPIGVCTIDVRQQYSG